MRHSAAAGAGAPKREATERVAVAAAGAVAAGVPTALGAGGATTVAPARSG